MSIGNCYCFSQLVRNYLSPRNNKMRYFSSIFPEHPSNHYTFPIKAINEPEKNLLIQFLKSQIHTYILFRRFSQNFLSVHI